LIVFGWIVISIILICAVAGAIAACIDDEQGLGKEFLEGIYSIGYIFLPVAGIMASVPFLTEMIKIYVQPLFESIHANPAMAATIFIAVDMGGLQLARELCGDSMESWITAMTTGYMAGSTIVFSIPVGLAMLHKRDHKYMALGAMAGLLSIPIGVFIANIIIWMLNPAIRPTASISGETVPDLLKDMSLVTLLVNLAPLAGIVTVLALGLKFFPNLMIRLFMGFGRFMGIFVKLVLVACIVQYFTFATFKIGLFTWLFGWWGFDPPIPEPTQAILASKPNGFTDDTYIIRALEVAGYIGIMLAGAFPMVYLLRKYLSKPIELVGRKIGLDATGAAGMLAAAANILAMFRLVKDMRPRDKVLCIAFAVCAAFTFGDHLAFTTNFQPNLLLPVMLGKLGGGMCGFLIATWLCVPKALELEEKDMIDNVHTVLKHVPALKDRVPTAITKLRGGLTNTIYKIEYGNEAFVVRLFGKDTDLLGIDRDHEHAVSTAVAAAGVAPEVVAYLPKGTIAEIDDFQGASIVHFVVGKLLDEDDARKPEILQRIVQTLKACHAAPVGEDLGEPFSVFKIVKHYVDESKKNKVALPAAFDDAMTIMDRIEKEVASNDAPCLCHNDLLAGNFIDDGTAMRVIDWEYGGMGDRYFDLGNFAVNLQMSDGQEKALLQAYFGDATPEAQRRLKLMRLASDMREATWSYLQSALSKLHPPQYYLDRGNVHLERFRNEAKASGLVS